MILVDAGPLVAILDRSDAGHRRCVKVLPTLAAPLLTTWPVLTEALHLLGSDGWPAQQGVWQLVFAKKLMIHPLDDDDVRRTYELMHRYKDLPMDVADASLVAAAEALDISRVFTLDSDFRIYKLFGRKAFTLIP